MRFSSTHTSLKCAMALSLSLAIVGIGSADWPTNPEPGIWKDGGDAKVKSACEKQNDFVCVAPGCWSTEIAAQYRTCGATIYGRAKRTTERPVGLCVLAVTETYCGVRDYVYCAEVAVYDHATDCTEANFQCHTYVKYYGGGKACDPDAGGFVPRERVGVPK